MTFNLAQLLISATAASTAAILLVALLRKPLQIASGAQAAYWLWLLVPVSGLATLLPSPSMSLLVVAKTLPATVGALLNSAITPSRFSISYALYIRTGLIVWFIGAAAAFTLTLFRQLKFLKSLGEISSAVDGVRRSHSIVAPMLVGAWRPQVVVPIDFEARYTDKERVMMLAHERAHLERGDFWVNSMATAWLCFSWFNPLVYWAMGWLRQDQELACDAAVLATTGTSPRSYADALLKTQLITQSAWRMPVGCHWYSTHPLKRRILMLKRPVPGSVRRSSGMRFGADFGRWLRSMGVLSATIRESANSCPSKANDYEPARYLESGNGIHRRIR